MNHLLTWGAAPKSPSRRPALQHSELPPKRSKEPVAVAAADTRSQARTERSRGLSELSCARRRDRMLQFVHINWLVVEPVPNHQPD